MALFLWLSWTDGAMVMREGFRRRLSGGIWWWRCTVSSTKVTKVTTKIWRKLRYQSIEIFKYQIVETSNPEHPELVLSERVDWIYEVEEWEEWEECGDKPQKGVRILINNEELTENHFYPTSQFSLLDFLSFWWFLSPTPSVPSVPSVPISIEFLHPRLLCIYLPYLFPLSPLYYVFRIYPRNKSKFA